MRFSYKVLVTLGLLATSQVAAQTWSAQPWIADLSQARQAFETKYANIEWLEQDREVSLPAIFDQAASKIRSANSDNEARAIIDHLMQRIGDGHVSIDWPRTLSPSTLTHSPSRIPTDVCSDMGFNASHATLGVGQSLDGYRQIGERGSFPAGLVTVNNREIGVIRIGVFEPQGSPQICHAALLQLKIPPDKPCDKKCQSAVLALSYNKFTEALEKQIIALKVAGAAVLLVDVTNNGGGSEWAEAAARILSAKPLQSARLGFARGSHWAAQWKSLAEQLRQAAIVSNAPDRPRLLSWAAEAEAAQDVAQFNCIAEKNCSGVGRAGYATGLVGQAHSGEFERKPWADLVFSIAQFPYHDGVWGGPLVVLVDNETWSAAEEFSALLQDNRAAVILGARTGGAGCGHTNGGTPTFLANSGATLELPDCIRFRADGSNEVAGVIPDVLIGFRANDGAVFKSKLIEKGLPEAIRVAEQLH